MYYVIDKQMCVVCNRVADMPTPRVPSLRCPCAGCSTPIWVANKSPSAPPKICIRCIDDLDGSTKILAATPRDRRQQIH